MVSYEEQRQANIARNAAQLRTLGIPLSREYLRTTKKRKQSSESSSVTKRTKCSFALPTRRSSRHQGKDRPNYVEPSDTVEGTTGPSAYNGGSQYDAKKKSKTTPKASYGVVTCGAPPLPGTQLKVEPNQPLLHVSSRELCVDIDKLNQHVGHKVPGPPTKETVMNFFCEKGAVPRFSKYVGIQEWQNCIFLLMNVGGDCYANTFTTVPATREEQAVGKETKRCKSKKKENVSVKKETGQDLERSKRVEEVAVKKTRKLKEGVVGEVSGEKLHVTYYTGSRVHQDSPIVSRLSGSSSSGDRVVLFARPDASIVKPPGNVYTLLGFCRYVSHNPTSQPVEFVFELTDFQHKLARSQDCKELLEMS